MDRKTLLTLWRLLTPFHRRLGFLMFAVVWYEILKLAPAAVLAIVIDRIASFDATQIPFLLWLLFGLLVASTIISLLDAIITYQSSSISFDAEAHLLKRTSEKLFSLPLGYHEDRSTGSQMYALHRGCDRLVELIFFTGKEVGPTAVQLIITTVALLWIGWIPALLFLIFVPVFLLLIHRYGIRVQDIRHAYHGKIREAAGMITERMANIRTVQDFATEDRELGRYGSMLGEYLQLMRRRHLYQAKYFTVRDMMMNVSRVLMMSIGIWLVSRGRMTPGALVFFITLTEKANLSLFRMTNFYDRMGDSVEAVNRLAVILAEDETVSEKTDALPVSTLSGAIEFHNVSFHYGTGPDVLRSVSFAVQPKQMIAVIGRSGTGKSTLVKLLYRHFDVSSGAIRVDGHDVRDYVLREYRRTLATVPQDIEVFNATVQENIAFGNLDAPRADIERAAALAYATDFIERLPRGFSTLVGERGVKLSGGQKQRIGIARALLMKPSVLIFDEATSSLDTESEQLIQRAMWEIAKDFTMIVIAHRLSTIEHADLVIVLEDGEIAEMGSHEDLMQHRGIYRRMRELQRLGEVRT